MSVLGGILGTGAPLPPDREPEDEAPKSRELSDEELVEAVRPGGKGDEPKVLMKPILFAFLAGMMVILWVAMILSGDVLRSGLCLAAIVYLLIEARKRIPGKDRTRAVAQAASAGFAMPVGLYGFSAHLCDEDGLRKAFAWLVVSAVSFCSAGHLTTSPVRKESKEKQDAPRA